MVHPVTDEQVRFTGVPALCVEILSSNRGDDLVLKPMRYARAGLTRYWVVDPRDRALTAYRLTDEGLYEPETSLWLPDEGDEAAPGPTAARIDIGPAQVDVDLAVLLGG